MLGARFYFIELIVFLLYYPMNNSIPISSIQNTKLACALMTLGCELKKPLGVFITYDLKHPQSTNGVAHFLFENNLTLDVQKYCKSYEENIADVTLDEHLETLKEKLSKEEFKSLEDHITHALMAYSNKLLSNYQVICKDLKERIHKYAVTGGSPVYDQGKIVGIQEFSIRRVK